ncbi:MAG: beta-Ala-His dipeptidase [Lentisphaeria bacterium]
MTCCIESYFRGPAANAWQYFQKISSIPRPSGHEEKISLWLYELAAEKQWLIKRDQAGNIAIFVEGRGSLSKEEPICIQGHLDMVCEKNSEIIHDFLNDSLELTVDGDWLKAKGTTLGADNGVAIALGLAIASANLKDCLPIELLFTVEEETGLTGANNLDSYLVSARTFVNIDSEEEGTFIIGCAGGELVKVGFATSTIESQKAYKCVLSGLRGGHSGLDVAVRYNAIVECAKLIKKLTGARLHLFESGDKHNAIPRECSFVISNCSYSEIERLANLMLDLIKKSEPNVKFEITECITCTIIPNDFINFITSVENGVLSMHPEFTDIVQTSTSITIVEQKEEELFITISTRSSNEEDKFATNQKIVKLAELSHATAKQYDSYPGWDPQKDSKILRHCTTLYEEMYNKKPNINSIHAGLECGIIGKKLTTNELISLGPIIHNPHSPEERLSISSFNRIYQFLEKICTTKIN